MQAGDLVPEITFTKVMASPDGSSWSQSNLRGCITAVSFFANVYDATEAFASLWNELVDEFADQRVQFVLITRDDRSELETWLHRNPLKGWLLVDANWATFHSGGVQASSLVFIDREAKAIGFDHGLLPNEAQLKHILAGQPEKARLRSKPQPFGGDKPDIPPSYQVHISPSKREPEDGTSGSSGPDHWTRLGFELKAVIAEVYGADETRIDLPSHLGTDERYDFEVLLPQDETFEKINHLVRQEIERHFNVTVSHETRFLDVYVLTLPNGMGPLLHQAEFGGGGSMGMSHATVRWHSVDGNHPTEDEIREAMRNAPLSNISGSGMSIADICRALESHRECLVVDETGLDGSYNFHVTGDGESNQAFLQALYDQLGILATPGRRKIPFIVFHPTRS